MGLMHLGGLIVVGYSALLLLLAGIFGLVAYFKNR
jgi:hypothetical protein